MSFTPGARAAFRRVLLQEDFDRFARLSGDDNPIHCDPDYARGTHFGATVSHGMLLYSLVCKALSELIPGPGALQLEQELMFPNPTYAGEEVEVALEVLGRGGDGSLELATRVSKQNGTVPTAEGRARVLPAGLTAAAAAPAEQAPAPSGDAELYGLRPGMAAEVSRCHTAADLAEYGDLTGDRNPLFRGADAIVPWPLLAGLFSALLGTRLPGRGTGWMKQRLAYPGAARPGETLTARVEIVRLRADKELVNLRGSVTAADGRRVCDGESLVLVRNLETRLRGSVMP